MRDGDRSDDSGEEEVMARARRVTRFGWRAMAGVGFAVALGVLVVLGAALVFFGLVAEAYVSVRS